MNLSSSVLKTLFDHFDVWGDATVGDDLITVEGDVIFAPPNSKSALPVRFRLVTGGFNCSGSGLTKLDGCPQEVGGNFYCHNNKLTDLKGAPTKTGGDFYCGLNQLTSLDGAPMKVGRDFWCETNPLVSLDGSPSLVGGIFTATYDPQLPLLRTLVAQQIDLKPRMGTGRLTQAAEQVLNKHAGKDRRGVFSAAKELLQAGEQIQQEQGLAHNPFERNARW
jgi:hypothetical protein